MTLPAKIALGCAVALVFAQLFRPSKNRSAAPAGPNDVLVLHPASPHVKELLEHACYDCHSDNTRYPWYAEVQPVGWWLGRHVRQGRRHLNFSQFGSYPAKRAARKFEQTVDQLRDHEMPLSSYTWIHRDARLSSEDAAEISNWAREARKTIAVATPSHAGDAGK